MKLTELSDNKLNKSVNFHIGNKRNEPFMKNIRKWDKFHWFVCFFLSFFQFDFGKLSKNRQKIFKKATKSDAKSIEKPAYFIIWFSFNNNFRFSIKWYSRAQRVILHKYVKYTCSMETVQQNGRFNFFFSKFLSKCYILYALNTRMALPDSLR